MVKDVASCHHVGDLAPSFSPAHPSSHRHLGSDLADGSSVCLSASHKTKTITHMQVSVHVKANTPREEFSYLCRQNCSQMVYSMWFVIHSSTPGTANDWKRIIYRFNSG